MDRFIPLSDFPDELLERIQERSKRIADILYECDTCLEGFMVLQYVVSNFIYSSAYPQSKLKALEYITVCCEKSFEKWDEEESAS